MKHNQLWIDSLEAPDTAVWPELRGDIADILDPSGWIAINIGFLAVDHMRDFAADYRKLGHDDTTELSPRQQETFAPIIRDISAAREALHPVAYPRPHPSSGRALDAGSAGGTASVRRPLGYCQAFATAPPLLAAAR